MNIFTNLLVLYKYNLSGAIIIYMYVYAPKIEKIQTILRRMLTKCPYENLI